MCIEECPTGLTVVIYGGCIAEGMHLGSWKQWSYSIALIISRNLSTVQLFSLAPGSHAHLPVWHVPLEIP